MAFQAMEFWPCLQYQSQIPSWVAALKPNTEAISLPHTLYVSVTPVKTPCLAVWYCRFGINVELIDNSFDDFSFPVMSIASSGTLKASQQGHRGFQLSLWPTIMVLFSATGSYSSSGRWLRATAMFLLLWKPLVHLWLITPREPPSFLLLLFFFIVKLVLNSPCILGWLWINNPPASVFQVLELQLCLHAHFNNGSLW